MQSDFLTGYHDIKKMQYALRNESVDFILKTEGNEIILNSVRRAMTALDDKLTAEQVLSKAQEQLRLALPIMHERIMLDLLNGETLDRSSFEEIEFPLDVSQKVLLLFGHIDADNHTTSNTKYRLKNLADSIIGRRRKVLSVIKGQDILWLVQPVDGGADRARQAVQLCMEDVQQICKRVFGVSMSFVLAQNFIGFEEVLTTWFALKKTVKDLSGLSEGMLLIESPREKSQQDASAEWLCVNNILLNIQMSVDNLQSERYERQYEKLAADMQKSDTMPPVRRLEALLRLYLVFLANSNEGIQNTDLAALFTGNDDWDACDRIFRSLAAEYFSKQTQCNYKNSGQLWGRIRQYINQNLDGDLSLATLAQVANFSPSYLSRLFKQMTNISLTDYIGQQKCKRAKKLLCDTNLKIAEVAHLLGFETPSYFTRFFKKYTGMVPQEYRESTKQERIMSKNSASIVLFLKKNARNNKCLDFIVHIHPLCEVLSSMHRWFVKITLRRNV